MKKNAFYIYLFFNLFFFPKFILAQTEPFNCSFVPTPEYYDSRYTGMSQKASLTDGTVYIINVKFLLIAQNGVSAHGVTEQHLLETIALMNREFNKWKIFFKYRGFSFLENTDYPFDYVNDHPANLNDALADFIDAGIFSNDMFNIMVLNGANNGRLGAPTLSANSIINNHSRVIIHELGHALGLLHIFSGIPSRIDVINPDCNLPLNDEIIKPLPNTDSENITRDMSDPNYNATTRIINGVEYRGKGDLIFDTPACFYQFEYNVCMEYPSWNQGEMYYDFYEDYRVVDNSVNNNEQCYYCSVSHIEYCYTNGNNYYTETDQFGNVSTINLNTQTWTDIVNSLSTDCNKIIEGKMFRDLEPFCYNYMSYGWFPNFFTLGQAVRMHETIETSSVLQRTLAKLPDGTPDFSVLYEPYAGEYYLAGATLPEHRPLFQPGFDYYFVDCTGNYPRPSDYNDIQFSFDIRSVTYIDKFSLDTNNITHPNHTAMFIRQLNDVDLNNGGQPRKCYDNFNRTPSNGEVIEFEDGIINENIIIHPKNQTEINDENLIQNLDNGLYIIKKNYDDGTQEQRTVHKSGN